MSTITKLIILAIAELYFTHELNVSPWLILSYGVYSILKIDMES